MWVADSTDGACGAATLQYEVHSSVSSYVQGEFQMNDLREQLRGEECCCHGNTHTNLQHTDLQLSAVGSHWILLLF